jgi:23S rRNA (guanine745-N1)-methyltransferase
VGTATHREDLSLDHPAVATLVGMGPHARHLSPPALAGALAGLADPVAVTVSVDVTTYERVG